MSRFVRAFLLGFGRPMDAFGSTPMLPKRDVERLAAMTRLPVATVELYLDWLNVGNDISHAMKEWKEIEANVQTQPDRARVQA